jgi:cytochrome P450
VALHDLFMGPGYPVTRSDNGRAVRTDAQTCSSRSNANGIGRVMGRTILEMDGREHTRQRGSIAPAFVPGALRGNLPAPIAGIVDELIDGFAAAHRAELVCQFTSPLPIRAIAFPSPPALSVVFWPRAARW